MPSTVPRERVVLALVFAVTLTSIMGNSLLSPAIPDVLDEFDRPDSAAGLLIAAVTSSIAAFNLTRIRRRDGRRDGGGARELRHSPACVTKNRGRSRQFPPVALPTGR